MILAHRRRKCTQGIHCADQCVDGINMLGNETRTKVILNTSEIDDARLLGITSLPYQEVIDDIGSQPGTYYDHKMPAEFVPVQESQTLDKRNPHSSYNLS